MSAKRDYDVGLLRSLLVVLIEEWGGEVVRSCLEESLSQSDEAQKDGRVTSGKSRVDKRQSSAARKKAGEMVEKILIPSRKKELIIILAERYDKKLFLPSSGDVRYFFESYGEDAPYLRQRSDVFRSVLRLLSRMSEMELNKLIDDGVHSGPANLDSLSDAMREVGEQRLTGQAITAGDAYGASEIEPCPPADEDPDGVQGGATGDVKA